tara:strand:- start:19273 stop:21603 length:2331 start_codon:yes stop_codon:yes gene_type:complete
MATTKFKTIIEVATKGFEKLGNAGSFFNNINQASKNSTAAVDKFGNAMGIRFPKQVNKAGQTITGFGKRVGMLGNVFGKVRGVMRGLSGAISAIVGFKVISEITQLVNQAQSLSNKLRVVSKDAEQLTRNFKMMGEVARSTRSDLDGTITMFQRLTFASSRLGASQEQVAIVTENVNKLMTIQGVQAHEARSVLLQLSQGFQSGKLAGDEFRAISETLPPILDILAKETGRSREELKKLASEGFLKPTLILNALLKETSNIDKQFKKTSVTLAQGMNLIKTELIIFTQAFMDTEILKDIVSASFSAIAKSLEAVGNVIMLVVNTADVLYRTFIRLLQLDFKSIFDDLSVALGGVDMSAARLAQELRDLESLATQLGLSAAQTKEQMESLASKMTELSLANNKAIDGLPLMTMLLTNLSSKLGLLDVPIQVAKERMKELADVASQVSIPFADIEEAIDTGKLKFEEFQKSQAALAKATQANDLGLIFDPKRFEEQKNAAIIGYAFLETQSGKALTAITENNRKLMDEQGAMLLDTQEKITAATVIQAEITATGISNATKQAESQANAWLFNWEGNMAAFQDASKAAFGAFSNGAATAFASVLTGSESFGKAFKKMIIDFAKQMIMQLVKVALAMIAIKIIAGMGGDPSKIGKILNLSGSIGKMFSDTGTGSGDGGDAVPAAAAGGIVRRPTLAMVGEGGEPEAIVPLSKAEQMGFGGGGQPMVIQNLSIFPNANLDAALLDRPQSYWVDLVQEKVLPALNELGTSGSTVTLEFQETR